jgi:DNA-binding protein WhiA
MTAECIAAGDNGPPPTIRIKDELARRPSALRCCQFTETAVMLRLAGTVQVDRGSMRMSVVLDHCGAARRLAVAVTTLTGQEPILEAGAGRGSANRWVVRVETGAAVLARKVGLCDGTGRPVSGIPQHVMVSAACCQAAAWRGAVLATGALSVTAGERRLRVGCPDLPSAMSLAMLAARIAAKARVPAVGPPQVLVEVAGDLETILTAIGAGETTVAAVARPGGRPRASAERLRATAYGVKPTSSAIAARWKAAPPPNAEADRARR